MGDGGKGSSPRPFSVSQEEYSNRFDAIFNKKVAEITCGCYNCMKDQLDQPDNNGLGMARFIVCPHCGNKRCPKATNHKLACTDSNDPGQPGSRYK
jgi:hypothetical protein